MKLEKTLKRVANHEFDRAARDIGHELPRKRYAVLSRFRTELAILANKDEVVANWAKPVVEIIAAYQAEIKIPVEEDPECPGPECMLCTGEYCAIHTIYPCDCDCLERHYGR